MKSLGYTLASILFFFPFQVMLIFVAFCMLIGNIELNKKEITPIGNIELNKKEITTPDLSHLKTENMASCFAEQTRGQYVWFKCTLKD